MNQSVSYYLSVHVCDSLVFLLAKIFTPIHPHRSSKRLPFLFRFQHQESNKSKTHYSEGYPQTTVLMRSSHSRGILYPRDWSKMQSVHRASYHKLLAAKRLLQTSMGGAFPQPARCANKPSECLCVLGLEATQMMLLRRGGLESMFSSFVQKGMDGVFQTTHTSQVPCPRCESGDGIKN